MIYLPDGAQLVLFPKAGSIVGRTGSYMAIIYAICTALRLARYNTFQSDRRDSFIGLPSPAAGGSLAAFARGDGGDRLVETHVNTVVIKRGNGARNIGLTVACFHRAAQRAFQRLTIDPVQLLRDQANGHQTRMVVTLSNNQNIVFDIFVDHVPRIFATFFRPADTQAFTLA